MIIQSRFVRIYEKGKKPKKKWVGFSIELKKQGKKYKTVSVSIF